MITNEMERVIADIRAERIRQVDVEGWTAEHDDTHMAGEMARAAACYAFASSGGAIIQGWPFAAHWWKPENGRRDLVKAGALIIAEIERLDRLALFEAAP